MPGPGSFYPEAAICEKYIEARRVMASGDQTRWVALMDEGLAMAEHNDAWAATVNAGLGQIARQANFAAGISALAR